MGLVGFVFFGGVVFLVCFILILFELCCKGERFTELLSPLYVI